MVRSRIPRVRHMRALRASVLMGALVSVALLGSGWSSAPSTRTASPSDVVSKIAPASAPCSNASKGAGQVAALWKRDEQALGVPVLKPPASSVCYVDTSSYKKRGPYTIAFASQGPTNAWASESDAYVRYVAKQNHVKLLYASANGSGATQVGEIPSLLAQNPQLLMVQPLSSGVEPGLHRAALRHIPVVVCTGLLTDTNDITATVNRSYALDGTIMAQWVAKKIGGKGQVAMLSGIAGVPTAEYTYQAGLAVFKHFPGIKIVTHQYTNWSPSQAKTVAASMLVEYPNIKAIWSDSASNDEGVIAAYTAAHKAIPPLTGDSPNLLLKLAKQYHVQFAVSAYPPEQCGEALAVAVKILEGKSVPNQIPVNSAVYTNKQLAKYYRPSCSVNLYVPSLLPLSILRQLKLCP